MEFMCKEVKKGISKAGWAGEKVTTVGLQGRRWAEAQDSSRRKLSEGREQGGVNMEESQGRHVLAVDDHVCRFFSLCL